QLVTWGLDFGSGLADSPDANVATTFVDGLLTGATIPGVPQSGPYQLGPASPEMYFTAITPTGIGPQPVIASDNALGAFSVHQGRLYAAFVQDDPNVNFLAGGYSDNTDVMLAVSDDGGVTWAPATTVNDDNSQKDGFTESISTPGLKLGRAQFAP